MKRTLSVLFYVCTVVSLVVGHGWVTNPQPRGYTGDQNSASQSSPCGPGTTYPQIVSIQNGDYLNVSWTIGGGHAGSAGPDTCSFSWGLTDSNATSFSGHTLVADIPCSAVGNHNLNFPVTVSSFPNSTTVYLQFKWAAGDGGVWYNCIQMQVDPVAPSPSPSTSPAPSTSQYTFADESNQAGARMGTHVTYCDINNDGITDLVSTGLYSVYAWLGNSGGYFNSTPSSTFFVYNTSINTDGLGLACADLNSDGYDDVIVGNWTANPQFLRIYNGTAAGISSASAGWSFSGSGWYYGSELAVADFNNDGLTDLAVSAYGIGKVYLHYATVQGVNSTLVQPAALSYNSITYAQNIAPCDLSGDGYPDLLVGCRSCNSSRGLVHIVSNNGGAWNLARVFYGTAASASFGIDAKCGDFNADGRQDVAILAAGERALYIYYGTGNISTLSSVPDVRIFMTDTTRSLSIGDIDFDGYDDILVGATGSNQVRIYYGGAALYSNASALYSYNGPSGSSGFEVQVMPNMDGAGSKEIAFGSYTYSNGQTNEGAVTVVYNPARIVPSPSVTPSPSINSSPSASPSPSVSPSVTPSPSSAPSSATSATPSVTPFNSVTPLPNLQTSWTTESNQAGFRLGAHLVYCHIDNDGYVDLVSTGVNGVMVWMGQPAGTYNTAPSFTMFVVNATITTDGLALECADVNMDGFADIIVGDWTESPNGKILIYNGTIFGPIMTPTVFNWTQGVNWYYGSELQARDVDGDGLVDLAVGLFGIGKVVIHQGMGAAGLNPTSISPAALSENKLTYAQNMEFCDLSGDGFPDLLVGCRNCAGTLGTLYIVSNNVGTWTKMHTWNGTAASGFYSYDAKCGDFNGDGRKDFAVLAQGEKALYIHYGTGNISTISRTPNVAINLIDTCHSLSVGDINNDGCDDIIGGFTAVNQARIFLGGSTLSNASTASFIAAGPAGNSGWDVLAMPNLDGGVKEFAFGSYTFSNGETNEGAITVVYNPQTVPLVQPTLSPSVAPSASVTPTPFGSISPSPMYYIQFTTQEKLDILQYHNDARAAVIPAASNMLAMIWNTTLELWAQTWVNGCQNNDSNPYIIDQSPSSSRPGTGQNIYATSDLALPANAVNSWNSEKQYYDYVNNYCSGQLYAANSPVWGNCAHYTQLVWASSNQLGCAKSTCPSITYPNTIVCIYSPAGNIYNIPTYEFDRPYETSVPTASASPSSSVNSSVTPTPSRSPSRTPSPTRTPSMTPNVTVSLSPSPSPTPSQSPSSSPVTTPPSNYCSQCSSNTDCSNGRGICVTSDIGSYCSCLSGFGGCDCSELPSSFCNSSYSQVDALSGNFQASTAVDYIYPMLFVTVTANSEESVYGNGGSSPTNLPPYSTDTIIYFGSSPSDCPSCSYPNGGYTWIDYSAQPGMCDDRYLSNMTWAFARDVCGFTAINGSRNYTQTVTIQRHYNLNGILQRTEQTTRSLNVIFPEEISVSDSNVTVSYPSADAFAAITLIDYNPNTLLWTVQVQTSIASPYSLGSPSLVALTGTLAQRTPTVSSTGCTPVSTYCVQTITYTYPQGNMSDPCVALFGQDKHSFSVSCSTPSCPSSADFNITLQLNTGNACPATDYITFSETSLSGYTDASLNTPASAFTINDDAYFGASVQTSEAVISSRTLKPNSVCFKPSSGPCFYVNYTLELATAGKDPVFLVDINGPGNAEYFNNITSPTQFTVNAVVQVDFVGAKGLMKNVPQSQSVQTVSHATIQPAGDSTMSSGYVLTPFVALVAMCLLLL